MKKKNKEKGFSLVELLAVVVILGLLSTVAIIGVNSIIKSAEKKYYEGQENAMIMGTESYVQNNRSSLPKTIGSSTKITLKTLEKGNYVKEIKDRSDNNCNVDKSYVEVFRYSQDGYSYRAFLSCPAYETGQNSTNENKTTIKYSYLEDGEKNGEDFTESKKIEKSTYKNPSIKINMEDPDKIISYSYTIYSCQKINKKEYCSNLKSTGSVEVPRESKKEIKFNIKEYLPAELKIEVTVIDIYGSKTNEKVTVSVIPTDGPICGEKTGEPSEWTNNPEASYEVTVKCIDRNGSGCEREIYSQIFTKDNTTGNIIIKDKSGKQTSCPVKILIDLGKPTKPVIKNPYENKWSNKSYQLTISSSDKDSGIAYFEYRYPKSKDASEQEWHKFSETEKSKITPTVSKERSETMEVRACDYAGNCSEAAKTIIKIDKTTPTCTITKDKEAPDGTNGWYKSNVKLTLNVDDKTTDTITAVPSNVSKGLTTSAKVSYNGTTTTTLNSNTKDTGIIYYGYVKDAAGNVSTCKTETLKLDKTPPKGLSITNKYNNKWTNKDYDITVKATDDNSGMAYFEYRYPKSIDASEQEWQQASEKEVTTITLNMNKERSEKLEVRACDKAGNCTPDNSIQSTTIKIDKTTPTCTITRNVASPDGKNGWYISALNLELITIDSTTDSTAVASKMSYGFTTSNKATYNSKTKYTQKDTEGIIYYGFVKDEAGNVSSCQTESFKVDTTPPNVTYSTGGIGYTAIVTCSDDISGVVNKGTTWSVNKETTFEYTCENNAGLTNYKAATYKYNTCAVGENTCKYGCDSCLKGQRCCKQWDDHPESTHCILEGTCYSYVSCNCSACHTGENNCKEGYKAS